jgi:hypothetical protein
MQEPAGRPQESKSASDEESQNRVLDLLVDLTTTRVLLGIVVLFALGLALVSVSFQLAPPGEPETYWSFVIRWVGMGVIVTAVTSALLQLLISRARKRFEGELNQFLERDVTKELNRIHASLDSIILSRRTFGLVGFRSATENGRFDFSGVFNLLKPGDELLWLDTYAPTYREFQGYMENALRTGVKLRMLVIDSACDNARLRAEEIDRRGFGPRTFSKEVDEFRDWIRDVVHKVATDVPSARQDCRVRVYDDLPCIPLYIIVREGLPVRGFNSFFLTEPTAYFVHLEWEYTREGLLTYMHRYFEQKWKSHEDDEYRLFPVAGSSSETNTQ